MAYGMDITALEREQRKFTRMLLGIKHFVYEKIVHTLVCFLQNGGGNVIVCRIMRELDTVDREKLFTLADMSKTRAYRFVVCDGGF